MNPLFVVVWSVGDVKIEVLTERQVERRGYKVTGRHGPETGPQLAGLRSIVHRVGSSKTTWQGAGTAVGFGRREHEALELLDRAGEVVEVTYRVFGSHGEVAAAMLGSEVRDLGGAGSSAATRFVSHKRLEKLRKVGLAIVTETGGFAITEAGRAAMAARRDPAGLTPPPLGTQGVLFEEARHG